LEYSSHRIRDIGLIREETGLSLRTVRAIYDGSGHDFEDTVKKCCAIAAEIDELEEWKPLRVPPPKLVRQHRR
jgi:hypothetical protein